MELNELKHCIDSIEECADKAKVAARGTAPAELRRYVDALHQLASQAKEQSAGQLDPQRLRDAVLQLEQTADQAMRACREAGAQATPELQQALQRAHDTAARTGRQLRADAAA